ncbi:ABC transporter permease [Arthrobacter roseus]|uniref:ABC transporter permease n=1 Tax=Arthrobacter roseus TaxID=136274 RepID=UPI0019658867|nr:ABC transporter permease [Arthrobacter roseus]MBM7847126.1 putative ABC transport system permease protein [Arthrobacter roseus]
MFLALRDIRFAEGRFALMGSVVALITLLLVMLSGLTAGLGNQSTSGIASLSDAGATTIAFGAPEGSEAKASYMESQVSAAQVKQWKDKVEFAEPLGISQTRFQAGSTTNVAVFGVEAGGQLQPATVKDGTVVISSSIAEDLGVETGDMASLGGVNLIVSEVVEDQWYSHTPVVWTSTSDWQKISHISDSVGSVVVAGADADVDGMVTNSVSGSFQALGSYQSEHGSLLMMQGFLYGISALVIVAFLTVWTVQRTRDIAVLKALGGSSGYVLKDALTQAAIVLVAGALLGGVVGLVGGFFAAQAAPFLVSAATTLVPVAGIVVLGLAGSALAVQRVTRVDPLIALGGN